MEFGAAKNVVLAGENLTPRFTERILNMNKNALLMVLCALSAGAVVVVAGCNDNFHDDPGWIGLLAFLGAMAAIATGSAAGKMAEASTRREIRRAVYRLDVYGVHIKLLHSLAAKAEEAELDVIVLQQSPTGRMLSLKQEGTYPRTEYDEAVNRFKSAQQSYYAVRADLNLIGFPVEEDWKEFLLKYRF